MGSADGALAKIAASKARLLEAVAVGCRDYANGAFGARPGVYAHYTPGNAGRYGWPPLSAGYAASKAAGTVRARGGVVFLDKGQRGELQGEMGRFDAGERAARAKVRGDKRAAKFAAGADARAAKRSAQVEARAGKRAARAEARSIKRAARVREAADRRAHARSVRASERSDRRSARKDRAYDRALRRRGIE